MILGHIVFEAFENGQRVSGACPDRLEMYIDTETLEEDLNTGLKKFGDMLRHYIKTGKKEDVLETSHS